MFDSIDPNAIPLNAQAVAWYLDGVISQWPTGAIDRFPTTLKKSITTLTTPDIRANICDCEQFDATPQAAADWAHQKAQLKQMPIIYCSLNTWPTVKALTTDITVLWWIADPTGIPHIVQGATATQDRWASLGQTGGIQNVDISSVDISFFGGLPLDQATFNALMDGYYAGHVPNGLTGAAEIPGATLDAVRQGFNQDAAIKGELDTLKAEIEAGSTITAAAAIARIEVALQKAGTALSQS